MSSQQRYGAPVNTDNVSSALETTRRLRLALNVLWDDLPDDMNDTPVREALQTIHNRITQAENASLRTSGLAEHYLIIRPLSPLSPPPIQTMEKIASAARTLAELGMLAGQNDASYRDPE
jgi:hypothetical protein